MSERVHPLQPDWSSSTYNDRFRAIEPYVRGRSVLDIGAVSGYLRADWMHAQIAAVAARAVGVDVDSAGVEAVQARGYDIRLGDAQELGFDEQFEVVFAGELIEHLANCGAFLEAARRHIAPGGKLIVTTPNAFCFTNFVYRLGFKARIHHEHTCWFCEDTLAALLVRCGYRVLQTKYLPHRTPGRGRRVAATLAHSILPPRLAWRTVMIVASRAVDC